MNQKVLSIWKAVFLPLTNKSLTLFAISTFFFGILFGATSSHATLINLSLEGIVTTVDNTYNAISVGEAVIFEFSWDTAATGREYNYLRYDSGSYPGAAQSGSISFANGYTGAINGGNIHVWDTNVDNGYSGYDRFRVVLNSSSGILPPINGNSFTGGGVQISANSDSLLSSTDLGEASNSLILDSDSWSHQNFYLLWEGGTRVTILINELTSHTANQPPIADAGPDQAIIAIGSTVQFDGTQSWDPEGVPITYSWTIISQPEGSAAALSDDSSANPTFLADVHGRYEIELVVSDGSASSTPDQVFVDFDNVPPVSNAGTNQSVAQGDQVCFDGNSSTDDNGDILSFTWSLTTPDGSSASLDDPLAEITCLTTDLPGTYEVTLVVNDGWVDSPPSTASAYAASYQDATTMTLQETITTINDIPLGNLKSKNMQNSLTRKVNAVLALIEQGEYADALDKLQNNLLDKNNGCATSGSPDKNDWIQDCAEQDQVYQLIMEAIDYVTPLVEKKELKNAINNYEEQPELFFNSLDTQALKSNASLLFDDIPMVNIGGNIIDAMSVIEFMIIGDYGSATSSAASIAMAKMIPLIGQLLLLQQQVSFWLKSLIQCLQIRLMELLLIFLYIKKIKRSKNTANKPSLNGKCFNFLRLDPKYMVLVVLLYMK